MDNSRKKLRLGDVLVNSGVISEERIDASVRRLIRVKLKMKR